MRTEGRARIWFINRYFYPDLSATAQILTELAEDLDARGAAVTMITGRTSYLGDGASLPARELHKGIEIRRVRCSNFGRRARFGRAVDYFSFYLTASWGAMKVKRQDLLVVLTDPPMLSVLAAVVRVLKQCKAVCWMQDVFPDIAVQAGVLQEGFLASVLRRLALWSLWRMDRILVLGRCMQRKLLELGLPTSKLVQIPNWADGALIQPVDRDENSFRSEHGLLDQFVVMYSGNLGIVHELDTILAMILETKSIQQICYCFVGDGLQKALLVENARRERWSHVTFLPYQPKERLRFSLAAADVHLVTLRPEMVGLSIPSKIYGIMAAGRPVIFIGPDDSEVAHLIREAGCGFVIRPGDVRGPVQAFLSYYWDPAQREKHGHAARAYFEQHCDRSFATQRFWRVLQQT